MESHYRNLAVIFGSLRAAFLAYAVILSILATVLLADAVWRCATWNWTVRDVFGEVISLFFLYSMIRFLLMLRRRSADKVG